jgi:hypothetical protein
MKMILWTFFPRGENAWVIHEVGRVCWIERYTGWASMRLSRGRLAYCLN